MKVGVIRLFKIYEYQRKSIILDFALQFGLKFFDLLLLALQCGRKFFNFLLSALQFNLKSFDLELVQFLALIHGLL